MKIFIFRFTNLDLKRLYIWGSLYFFRKIKLRSSEFMINLHKEVLKYEYNELQDLFKNAKTRDKQDFYIILCNLTLKREQKKIINQEY